MRSKKDYRGKAEVERWKEWGASQGYSVNTLHKWGDIPLRLYFTWIWNTYHFGPEDSGFKQVLEYKSILGNDITKKKTTKNNYLDAIYSYYEYRKDQDPLNFSAEYLQIKSIGKFKKAFKTPYQPLPLEHYQKMLDISETVDPEAFTFLMVLGYSGGRAQFYGLRRSEVFPEAYPPQIRKSVKGGKIIAIPLHPELLEALDNLIKIRKYHPRNGDDFYFEFGRPSETNLDYTGNQQRSEALTKRIAKLSGIPEPETITPHRFRKMTVTSGREMGLEPKEAQLIVGHSQVGTTEDTYNMPELSKIYDKFKTISFRKKPGPQSKREELKATLKELFKGFSKEEVIGIVQESIP